MNLLITKDEKDDSLGTFFEKCADIASSIFENSANTKLLSSQKLINDIVFSMTVSDTAFTPFNFFDFTHGNEDGLIVNNQNYVGCNENAEYWTDANLVYNYSCLSACQFGEYVTKQGANCFVGHNKTIRVQTLPKYENYFLNPLKTFMLALSENKNVKESLALAKVQYTDEIDSLYMTDMLTASVLLENRDSLVCYGNSEINI